VLSLLALLKLSRQAFNERLREEQEALAALTQRASQQTATAAGAACGSASVKQVNSSRACGSASVKQVNSSRACGSASVKQVNSSRACGSASVKQVNSSRACRSEKEELKELVKAATFSGYRLAELKRERGTQFACFTALLVQKYNYYTFSGHSLAELKREKGTQSACFTGTKVQLLTQIWRADEKMNEGKISELSAQRVKFEAYVKQQVRIRNAQVKHK
jgi:hypothetical protein